MINFLDKTAISVKTKSGAEKSIDMSIEVNEDNLSKKLCVSNKLSIQPGKENFNDSAHIAPLIVGEVKGVNPASSFLKPKSTISIRKTAHQNLLNYGYSSKHDT